MVDDKVDELVVVVEELDEVDTLLVDVDTTPFQRVVPDLMTGVLPPTVNA